ncbi:MAG TPA: hypothetical protein VET23_01830 [Chitinophagaceae bacterium]|nr:hypothetical protein [Chitinophagaceae bacterium]
MRNALALLAVIGFVTACNKTKPMNPDPPPPSSHPAMIYIDFGDNAIQFGNYKIVDLDKDGLYDIVFSTLLVGDPINRIDKKQWLVNSSFYTNLPVKNETIPVMNYGDSIPVKNFSGHEWYNASSIVLAQKIISFTQTPYWEGGWKQASHQYLPIQLNRNNELFNGWIEISFISASEKVVLHEAAICMEANKGIIAGH